MRSRVMRALAVAVVLAGSVALGVPAATAQTGPPPGLCTVTSGTLQDGGTHQVGDTVVIRLAPTCGFTPGDVVAVAVNNQAVGFKSADSAGTVAVRIKIQSASQLLVEDPVSVPAVCGTNSVVGTGFSTAAAAAVTQTTTFALVCPTTAPVATATGKLAFTGANLLRWTAFGAAALVLGTLLVLSVRRRRDRFGI
ncbi:MAG: heme exporter protein CcmD [Acidimicrobiales bacterium]